MQVLRFSRLWTLAVAASFACASHAVLVAHWNFNTLTPSVNNGLVYASSSGTATLTVNIAASDNAGSARGVSSFGGTTLNAVPPDPAGQDLAIQGGALETAAPVQNNGATMVMQFNLAGYLDPVLSYAERRSSAGFNSNQLAYSVDGSNWTDFGSAYDPSNGSYAVVAYDLSTVDVLDNAANVYLRITFNGATANSGNNRFDNIQLNAVVPEPGSIVAIVTGLAGFAAIRRRR